MPVHIGVVEAFPYLYSSEHRLLKDFSKMFLKGTQHRSSLGLSSNIHFRIHVAIGYACWDSNWIGRPDQCRRPSRQQALHSTVTIREVCCDSAEHWSVCISHNKQHRTYLHGATSELEVKTNGPAGLIDCKIPKTWTEIDKIANFEKIRQQYLKIC